VIEIQRLHEDRGIRHFSGIEAAEAHLDGARQHTRAFEDRLQRNAGPQGITHRAIAPFATRHARRQEAAAVARALVDGGKFDLRLVQNFLER
jgi:hypothetical protein